MLKILLLYLRISKPHETHPLPRPRRPAQPWGRPPCPCQTAAEERDTADALSAKSHSTLHHVTVSPQTQASYLIVGPFAEINGVRRQTELLANSPLEMHRLGLQ